MKKRSKQLSLAERRKFYGWYINERYNLRMSFEDFLSPHIMMEFINNKLEEAISFFKSKEITPAL